MKNIKIQSNKSHYNVGEGWNIFILSPKDILITGYGIRIRITEPRTCEWWPSENIRARVKIDHFHITISKGTFVWSSSEWKTPEALLESTLKRCESNGIFDIDK